MKKVTIHDIAKELNVSFSTVARALNDHPAISEATKKSVRETAQKLNYRQNKLASSLRSGHSNTIGVIVPSLDVSFFSSVVHGIEKIINENGYSILLYQSNESYESEKKGIETFLNSRVAGIIASVAKETTKYEHFSEIRRRRIPLLFFDRVVESLHVPSVTIDDHKGGFLATEHLIRQGYKRIVHITAKQTIGIFKERLRGYLDALKLYNLPVDESLILYGDFSLDFGRQCIRDLYLREVSFDAVFALEDFTAMGVLQQLLAYKVRVPEEVGVIGFANESFAALVTPGLSSIDQQTVPMGEAAAELFLKMLRSEDLYNNLPKRIVLDPSLIVRASTERLASS
ncbi:LacI family transcriptional regulator [Pontibacter ummariensis]|uniref:Transcriptional regulator, LacI family n=1 Tax=Pontibacter ummariensis TaxID=1610492 RepID=A0A239DN34_9BACT|nr:LacI family DNA-binding transcriptional regulator [Pontibacter ummariensis]PRY13866.1 LacI family transcriptional regulator [Pontibacter ummariensis]SNS33248.1 transcriptional regulator, LacI family [Pontibacter ummariensis]